VIVCIVDIHTTVDHRCVNFIFIMVLEGSGGSMS